MITLYMRAAWLCIAFCFTLARGMFSPLNGAEYTSFSPTTTSGISDSGDPMPLMDDRNIDYAALSGQDPEKYLKLKQIRSMVVNYNNNRKKSHERFEPWAMHHSKTAEEFLRDYHLDSLDRAVKNQKDENFFRELAELFFRRFHHCQIIAILRRSVLARKSAVVIAILEKNPHLFSALEYSITRALLHNEMKTLAWLNETIPTSFSESFTLAFKKAGGKIYECKQSFGLKSAREIDTELIKRSGYLGLTSKLDVLKLLACGADVNSGQGQAALNAEIVFDRNLLRLLLEHGLRRGSPAVRQLITLARKEANQGANNSLYNILRFYGISVNWQ